MKGKLFPDAYFPKVANTNNAFRPAVCTRASQSDLVPSAKALPSPVPSVLPQAVTQFEELVWMAETLLKGGGTMPTPASTLWRATNNSSPDSLASTCSNSASHSSSPASPKAEGEHPPEEKQVSGEPFHTKIKTNVQGSCVP